MFNDVILVSIGEIAIKGVYTRKKMQKALLRAMSNSLTRWGIVDYDIEIINGKIVVRGVSDIKRALLALTHVFGIEKLAIAKEISFEDLDELTVKVKEIYEDVISGKKFRVTARRVGRHPFTSLDMMKKIGEALRASGGIVNLENYETNINVEVRNRKAYTYTQTFSGPGGLPEGMEGKMLSLVSGGFDSPIAAWMLMKRGGTVDYVFFNIGGAEQRKLVYDVICRLYCLYVYNREQKLFDVEFRWIFPILEEIKEDIRGVFLKKAMYLAAQNIAISYGYKSLITGESLAQVSSQTLHNLIVSERGLSLPIFRPLIGMDKKDIIKKSMEIGTYPISSRSKEFCALATPHPSVSVDISLLEKYIERMGLNELIRDMTERYKKEVNLAHICDCREVIEKRLRELLSNKKYEL